MKNKIILLCVFFVLINSLSALENRSVTLGTHFLAGGRYDDVRMCIGSPPGVKGGPIMDVYLDIRFPAGENGSLVLNIPLMRPILFGAGFQMMQFEPQITYEHYLGRKDSPKIVLGGGLGIILHYGPDYLSAKESPGTSFFAMGPLFTASAGVRFKGKRGFWIPGVKIFYSPLFSPDYSTGHVLGGGIELHYGF